MTGSVGTISSAGIGSGLDVNTIVSKLVAIESQPLTDLQTSASAMKTQLSSVGQVQSYMSALQDASNKLSDVGLWSTVNATSSDTGSVTATTSSGATAANYSVNVNTLAVAQSAGSPSFASSSATVGTGTMTISIGSWTAGNTSFTASSTATPVSIDIESTDTLANIRDKINGANSGVVASIVTDSTGARLSIRSASTGVVNGFQIAVNDGGDGNDSDASGLSALAFDPPNGTVGMTGNQVASDANATINGMTVTSASNTLTNVLDGLTLTLNKATTSSVGVTVAADTNAIQTAITAFSTAYNNAMGYMRTATAYDASTSTAGPLQGDMTTVNLMAQLRTMVGGSSTASSVFQRFSDIGLDPQKDGTLLVDTTKLGSAMGNLPELQKMLAARQPVDGPDNAAGMASQLYILTSNALGFDGSITGETAAFNTRIADNASQQAAMQTRITAYQARVQAQYSALDTTMASLTSESSYVSQQMAILEKNS